MISSLKAKKLLGISYSRKDIISELVLIDKKVC